ncbi:MAG: hypothetical protein F6K40_15230 [Okeania sp. SIO3I5]|uniref:hypothetical protein n=1 Tax=Okeania sp. SIO3I5 TaxID=2607805 RepID=UPI0013BC4ED2|nr:hypothetical protein [Okeania sp. SIO3I5]NEQ37546.1 hypothetical protein [Okeania sp. SIO3I5]
MTREISTKIITSNIWFKNQVNRFSGEVSISIILGNFSQYFWRTALSSSGNSISYAENFLYFLIREISTKIITSNIWWENPLNRFSGEVSISIILGNFSQYFWRTSLSRSGKYLEIYLII